VTIDLAAWLASKGIRPLATATVPAVQPTAGASSKPRAAAASDPVAQRRAPQRDDVLPLTLSMPIPSTSVLSLVPVVVGPVDVEEHGVWAAMAARGVRIAAVAVAWAESGVASGGLWLPASSPYAPPRDFESLSHWTGALCPEPVARLLAAGAPVISGPLVVAQQVLMRLGWPQPARWLDATTQLCTLNIDGELDEVAAWLTGAADLSAWSSLRGFTGVLMPRQPLGRAMRQALAMTRIALGVAARCGTGLGTLTEDAAWAVDQRINARGLPIDRKLIELVKNLAPTPHVVAKFAEVLAYACPDDRVRGSYRFVSQHTGRWSACEPALHNLRKTLLKPAKVQALIAALQEGRALPEGDLAELIGNLERPMFLAPPGMVFVVGDQKQAEPRGVFYFAEMLEVLEIMDRIDLYLEPSLQTALFGNAVASDHPDAGRRRTALKIVVIACGFGMGATKLNTYAMETFDFDFVKAGVDPTRAVGMYRSVFRKVQALWHALGAQSLEVVRSKKPIATAVGTFRFEDGNFLSELRSGRVITYPRAVVVPGKYGPVVEYWKGGPLRGKRVTAWGGILFQHAVTGTLRDVHAGHLIELDAAGLNPIGHTHDEAVSLVEASSGPAAVAAKGAIMSRAPAYLPGLRLRCVPHLSERLGVEGLRR
jgi:hypothetical protein